MSVANILGGFNASYDRPLARHRVLRRLQRQPDPSSTLGSLLGFSTRLQHPCDPPILPTHDDPPILHPAGTEAEAYAYASTRARTGEDVAADSTPQTRICPLLAIKEDSVRYLREGPGTVYFTGQRNDLGQLIVKWGVTSCLPRRQLEYEECGGAGQTRMWFVAFEVQRCLLAGEFFFRSLFFRVNGV
ncbi:hypothetical protein B0H14DRAFT_3452904 [Mycena olivaceomarginata]|nr:hypothetical protein B0H14DRAFT_3452904 [Mycena olivaceomarginata]